MQELFELSATELMGGYRERRFSPVDVVTELSERIELLNPHLNAFCTLNLDAAATKAQESKAAIERGDDRALLGIPIAIKESY